MKQLILKYSGAQEELFTDDELEIIYNATKTELSFKSQKVRDYIELEKQNKI